MYLRFPLLLLVFLYVPVSLAQLSVDFVRVVKSERKLMLLSGGQNAMVPAVHQTWMPVEPLGDVAKDIDQWKQSQSGSTGIQV